MALSKNKLKYIRSLKEKKYRTESNVFIAEGNKIILDLIHAGIKCQLLLGTKPFLQKDTFDAVEEIVEVSEAELNQASLAKTPQEALAVFYQPTHTSEIDFDTELILALDAIQDPGNMGTIIRIADWYGIKHIFCSTDTVDVYNPKTVQATMGALARVTIHYVDLEEFLNAHSTTPIYGTLLNGQNMYEQKLTANGIIVMGNEGNGIRPQIEKRISRKLFIPNYPQGQTTSESLNVAIATAIVCAEFRRTMSI